jgi:hypothetical protein
MLAARYRIPAIYSFTYELSLCDFGVDEIVLQLRRLTDAAFKPSLCQRESPPSGNAI